MNWNDKKERNEYHRLWNQKNKDKIKISREKIINKCKISSDKFRNYWRNFWKKNNNNLINKSDTEYKKCNKCLETKLKKYFPFAKAQADPFASICRKCNYLRNRIWIIKNNEKSKKYRLEYYHKNIDRHRELSKKKCKKYTLSMTDAYIKNLICREYNNSVTKLFHKDIPQELVNAYRLNLIMKRKIKELNGLNRSLKHGNTRIIDNYNNEVNL